MATGTGRRGICLARACALALPRDRGLQDPEVKDPLSDVVSVIIALIPGARRLRSLLNYRLSSRQTMYPFQPFLPFYLFPPSPRGSLLFFVFPPPPAISPLLALEGDWMGYLMGHGLNYDRPLLSFLAFRSAPWLSREIP